MKKVGEATRTSTSVTFMPPVSEKTAYRDIQTLRQAGVLQICYSKRQKAFVLVSLDFTEPEWPERQPGGVIWKKSGGCVP